MKLSNMNASQLWQLEHAIDLIANTDFGSDDWGSEIATRREELERLGEWLRAENRWRQQVQTWLKAERDWKVWVEAINSPFYMAGAAGWAALKVLTPSLDGVDTFAKLPPSLQYRYAAFARGVYDAAIDPNVVLSTNQKSGRTSLPSLPEFEDQQ